MLKHLGINNLEVNWIEYNPSVSQKNTSKSALLILSCKTRPLLCLLTNLLYLNGPKISHPSVTLSLLVLARNGDLFINYHVSFPFINKFNVVIFPCLVVP